MKTLQRVEELFIDENNNSWSANTESYESATEKSNSLTACSDCYNCDNCSDCNKCSDCTYCIDCNCCDNCNDCDGCNNCDDCNYCSNRYNSNYLQYNKSATILINSL